MNGKEVVLKGARAAGGGLRRGTDLMDDGSS